MTAICLGIFGLLGVFSRWGIDQILPSSSGEIPKSTFLINLLGSFVAGFLFSLGQEKNLLSPELRTALIVGFCGGFTTFSAYSLQVAQMIREEHFARAFFYITASPVLGVLFAIAGMGCCKRFV